MITKEKLLEMNGWGDLHEGECNQKIGPRGGVYLNQQHVRLNGKCKTWKTRPDEFRQPIEIGFRDHDYITHLNAWWFHHPKDCPLDKEGK
jgi:hypothetical protein